MSESEEEIAISRKKTFKIFDDDDESDNDKKLQKITSFDEENSNHSEGARSRTSSKTANSDDERSNDSHSSVRSNTSSNSRSNSSQPQKSDSESDKECSANKRVPSRNSDDERSNDSHSSVRSNTSNNSRSNSSQPQKSDSESDKECSANKLAPSRNSDDERSSDSHFSVNSNTSSNSRSNPSQPQKSDSESDKEEFSTNKPLSNKNSDGETETVIPRSRDDEVSENRSVSNRSSDSEDDIFIRRSGKRKALSVDKSVFNGSSDSENETIIRRSSNDIAPPVSKSTGKFSLITESDLESDHDNGPAPSKLSSDSDFSSKLDKRTKKLKKKSSKSKKSSSSKSSGAPASINSDSENEEKSSPKRSRKSNQSKPEKAPKTSSKKEKDPLLSIRSETQRLIREGRISLPYHQPKQHTLHEFLQRRKTAPSMPLKTTPDVLKTVCEHLSMKEKEVEEFYKSESDHSDIEAQADTVPSNIPNENSNDDNQILKEALESNSEPNKNAKEITPCLENLNSISSNLEGIDLIAIEMENGSKPNDSGTHLMNENSTTQENILTSDSVQNDKMEITESLPNDSAISSLTEDLTINENILPSDTPENDVNGQIESRPKEIPPSPSMKISEDPKLMPESLDSLSATINESTKDTDTEDNPLQISDSVDFELTIEDSCKDTDPSEKTGPVSDSQAIDASKENESPNTPCENPAPKEINASNRLKRTMDLLSNYNIKLPSVKFDNIPDEIELEIPTLKEYETGNSEGLIDLKNKFFKHISAKNEPKKTNSLINVVSTQKNADGEIIGVTKETLVLNVEDTNTEFSHPKFSKPGAKRAYLKEKILKDLISKKEANWNEYQNEKRKYGSDSDEEKSEHDDDVSCKKLNFEPYHPEDEPDDDELLEEDIVVKEKERERNEFLDEEADVSDPEDVNDNIDESGEEDEGDCDNDEDAEDSDGLDIDTGSSKSKSVSGTLEDSNSNSLFKYNITGSDLENKLLGLESVSKDDETEDITASQVFGICSGKFTSEMVAPTTNVDTDFFSDSQNMEDSQNICLTLPDTNEIAENTKNTTVNSNRPEFLAESDAEGSDNEELFIRKKRALRIEDSDEESEIADTKDENSDEEINDNEDDDDGEEIEENEYDSVAAEELGYNSEEEMVPYTSKVATEFFENEAELSESEWGSEDENERDLDTLEKEEGDDDEIDNDKLKEELGKIHMRQLLDDDQHDVRLLKEMLLEDGELHSDAKRQRKFQWKNLDGDDFFLNKFNDSDDDNNPNDDDETEENWRRVRHERETYLSQQEGKSILNDAEKVESTFIQLPNNTKIVNESVTRVIQKTNVSKPAEGKADRIDVVKNSQFKGSFLSRGKYLLSKVTLSVADSNANVKGLKNGRNFVFGAKSPEKSTVAVTIERNEKRKSVGGSVAVTKKVKLSLQNGANSSNRDGILARLTLLE